MSDSLSPNRYAIRGGAPSRADHIAEDLNRLGDAAIQNISVVGGTVRRIGNSVCIGIPAAPIASVPMFYAKITGSYGETAEFGTYYAKHSWVEVEPVAVTYDSGSWYAWQEKPGGRKGTIATDPEGEKDPAYVLGFTQGDSDAAAGLRAYKGRFSKGTVVLLHKLTSADGKTIHVIHDQSPEVLWGTVSVSTAIGTTAKAAYFGGIYNNSFLRVISYQTPGNSSLMIKAPGVYRVRFDATVFPGSAGQHTGQFYWTKEARVSLSGPWTNTGTAIPKPTGYPRSYTCSRFTLAASSSPVQTFTLQTPVSGEIIVPVFENEVVYGSTYTLLRLWFKKTDGVDAASMSGHFSAERIAHSAGLYAYDSVWAV